MSVSSEIQRLQGAKADIKLAIENKGVSVPSSEKIDNYDTYISQIQGNLQEKTVTPDAIGQTVLPDTNYDGLSQVVVNGDANLIPSNVLKDVTIFGTTGTVEPYVAPNLQSKTATPSASGQTVVADTGYDGLSSVAIDGDFNLISGNIRKDVSIFGVTGTLDPQVAPNLQSKSVTPSASSQTVTPDTGYDGLSSVNVSGDGNLISSNIKKNVSIFGVTGNYEGSGGGSSELNVYVQNSEPASKKGVWIKDNSQGDTYLSAYYTKSGEMGSTAAATYLNTTNDILAQVVVGDFLYSFSDSAAKSYKYNIRTHTVVGNITVPSISWYNGTFGGGYLLPSAYLPSKRCIYVFYVNQYSATGGYLYYYKYFIDTNTYSTPASLCYCIGGSGCICDDKLYFRDTTSNYTGIIFDMLSESTTSVGRYGFTNFGSFGYSVGNTYYWKDSYNLYKYEPTIALDRQTNLYRIPNGNYIFSIFATSTDVYLFNAKYDGSYKFTGYLKYNISTNEVTEIEFEQSEHAVITYTTYNNSIAYDYVNGTVYIRTKDKTTFPFQLEDGVISENLSNGDNVIIQDLGYRNPVDIIDNPNIQIGVYDTFIKKNDSLDGNHASFWGDGKKWNLIKNPAGDTVTVSFDTAGGSGTFPSQQVVIGQTATEPQGAPTKTGDYVFDSWYLGNEPYDWNYKPVSDITLTAHYTEYEEVEYIQSTGTQYIDTGIVMTSNIRTDVDFQITQILSSHNPIVASFDDNPQNGFVFAQRSNGNFAFAYGAGWNSTEVTADLLRHTASINNSSGCSLDGTTLVTPSSITKSLNSGINITIFSWGNTRGYSKIYSCQIYNSGTLVRDFQPIKITSTGEYCLLDEVEHKVYHNAGTGAFIGEGYEPTYVEYLGSTGTQYIDTNFIPNQDTKIEIKAQFMSGTMLYGSRQAYNSNAFCIAVMSGSSPFKNFRVDYANESSITHELPSQEDVVLEQDKNSMYVNNTLIGSYTYTNFSTPVNLYLFGNNNNGSAVLGSHRIYYCKIYDNGTLVRDFTPALDYSGIPCLWDKVTETFYYNAGTGTFNYGELT